MRIRKQALGTRNICGAKIEQRRKAIGMKQKDLLKASFAPLTITSWSPLLRPSALQSIGFSVKKTDID